MHLIVDERRLRTVPPIHVQCRAQLSNGAVESVDIAALEKSSLRRWLKQNGGDNVRAEDVVGWILGHGPLTDPDPGHVGSEHRKDG